MIQGIIFDLDGTLLDSMHVWRDVDIDFFKERNRPMPENLQHELNGLSIHTIAAYFKEHFPFFTETEEEYIEIWNRMAYDKYRNSISMKPYAREFLERLSARKVPMALATSNSRKLVEAAFSHHDLEKYILPEHVVTSNEVPNGKPAPDIFLECARRLSVVPEDILVFEDMPEGLLAASKAGMCTCAIRDEYSDYLWNEKVSLSQYQINSYQDVPEDFLTTWKK